MEVQVLQSHFSFLFFSFVLLFLLFAELLELLGGRRWPTWCNCAVCRAYVTSSWAADFDNLCDWYTHLLRSSPSRTVAVHVLGCTLTANPDNVEHILKSRFDNFPKGKPFAAILGDLLGRGIFNVDGELWRFQRKMAAAELGRPAARDFASQVFAAEVAGRLLPLLAAAASEGGRVLDLLDVFHRLAFDTICRVSFGLDPGCLELSLPASMFAAAFDRATRLSAGRAAHAFPAVWKVKRLLNMGSERELREAVALVDLLAEEVIRQKRKLGFASDQDLLSQFMGCVDDDKYLRDIVVSFVLAGRDTVASALTSFFMLLSWHPAIAAAVRDEVERVSGTGGGATPSSEQLREMHYLHAAVHESMRLYPPVQFDSKFCVDDDVLPDGSFVRKGTRVTYHVYAMGRMEELWGGDCCEFRPERWLRGDGEFAQPESSFKYPVFQGGPRACLGKSMAILEIKTVIAAVVREFDVEVVGRIRPPKFEPGLTATLRGGLPVRVRRRKDGAASAHVKNHH